MTELAHLADLLVDTKDGDWGVGVEMADHSRHFVIRGADFPDVRRRMVETVPCRYLPDRTVWRRVLQPNDILLETAGGTRDRPTGRSLLITESILKALDAPVIGASFTRFLRADQHRVDPRYLYWYLQYLYSIGKMYEYQVQHTGVARFQYTVFSRTEEIRIPPVPQQRAVADVLCAVDEQIAANDRVVDTAEALMVAAVQSVTEYATLSVLATQSTASIKPEEFEDVVAHFSLPAFDDGAAPEIVSGRSIKSNKFALSQPCVLFSKLNPRIPRIWNVGYLPAHMALASTEFVVLTPVGLGTSALWAALCQPDISEELRQKVAGTSGSHQRIKPQELLDTRVLDVRELAPERAELVVRLGQICHERRRESGLLACTRDELLPLLMSGKVRVKDAEAAVSEIS